MFCADLTPYTCNYSTEPLRERALNVGWLSCEHPFTTGEVSHPFIRTLRRLISSPVFIPLWSEMGLHECEFCPPLGAGEPAGAWFLANPAPASNLRGTMGHGELWVPGAGSLVYVAPVLVAHYVEVHSYLPPQEFVDAVLAFRDAVGA